MVGKSNCLTEHFSERTATFVWGIKKEFSIGFDTLRWMRSSECVFAAGIGQQDSLTYLCRKSEIVSAWLQRFIQVWGKRGGWQMEIRQPTVQPSEQFIQCFAKQSCWVRDQVEGLLVWVWRHCGVIAECPGLPACRNKGRSTANLTSPDTRWLDVFTSLLGPHRVQRQRYALASAARQQLASWLDNGIYMPIYAHSTCTVYRK